MEETGHSGPRPRVCVCVCVCVRAHAPVVPGNKCSAGNSGSSFWDLGHHSPWLPTRSHAAPSLVTGPCTAAQGLWVHIGRGNNRDGAFSLTLIYTSHVSQDSAHFSL